MPHRTERPSEEDGAEVPETAAKREGHARESNARAYRSTPVQVTVTLPGEIAA